MTFVQVSPSHARHPRDSPGGESPPLAIEKNYTEIDSSVDIWQGGAHAACAPLCEAATLAARSI